MVAVNVLLVDDELPFVNTVTKRLSRRGMNIFTASSGEEALTHLESNIDIQIVVLDVQMPGMDGLETLAEIKRRYPSVEVIILTGHSTFESALKGMKLGAFDYLNKPCEVENLKKKILEATNQKRG